jgi:phage FluMu protein Com
MLHSGKCPHCAKVIASTSVETVDLKAGANVSYKGVSYLCPHCRSVLSVTMDQIAMNVDLVSRLLKTLGKR